MKLLTGMALLLLFAQDPLPAPGAGREAAALVGRWDSDTRSGEGVGTWLELSADGSCVRSTGLMIDGRWKLEGARLTVTTGAGRGTFTQVTTISLATGVLTQSSGNVRRTRTRVGDPPADSTSPLVGIWTYPYPSGGTAYDEYVSDGRFLFRLPSETASCRWSVTGDQLVMNEGLQPRSITWRLVANRLTLRQGAVEETFRRER